MSPMRAAASEPIEPAPVATAPTIYPPLPPKTIAEVSPELRAWAERQGAATSSSSADLPAVMLHGSPRPDIDAFDPYGKSGYGLFGTGTYLTDSADIAAEYTSKGLNRIKSGADQTLYAVTRRLTCRVGTQRLAAFLARTASSMTRPPERRTKVYGGLSKST